MTIKLVISDVDGTIVQPDKTLSPSTIAAAKRLQSAGIPLAIVSARPPRGMAFIAEQLQLTAPYAGFNGGMLVDPGGTPPATPQSTAVEWSPAHADAVQSALTLFQQNDIETWLFTQTEWLILDPKGYNLVNEERTVRFAPRVVDDFTPYIHQTGKLVGVSPDHPKLEIVERELQAIVGARATAHRSQNYYLDLTHPNANKGHAVRALARHQKIDLSEVAVLGDMVNDIPMFQVAGFSIAMGNGSEAAKAAASATTAANDHDGWAQAIDTLILPRTHAKPSP